jgi:apolipoprotein N-acyltransferase
VPLLCLVRTKAGAGRAVGLGAWAAGLISFWASLQWMRVADYRMYATWAALSTYCSVYFPAAVLLTRRLDRTTALPLVVTWPAVWTALEYLRGHFLGGFPWYLLGYTQHDFLAVAQVADLGGVYAVTFLLATANALVFECLCRVRRFRDALVLPEPAPGVWRLVGQAAWAVLLVGAALGYGFWRLGQAPFEPGPRIALIQGSLDQRIRNDAFADAGDAAALDMMAHYVGLADLAAAQRPRPALLVLPETSWPGYWAEWPPGQPEADSRDLALTLANRWHTTILLGLNARVEPPARQPLKYNSAVLIRPDGTPAGRYDKIHRVLFGEYVPLRDVMPVMNLFAPYDYDYSIEPGQRLTRFRLGNLQFGVLICYEDTDTDLARRYAVEEGDAAPVDFLLNISNDGWFNGTSEHDEHLAISRFRAIEGRRSLARAVNMGISAVIDGNGRVLRPTEVPNPGDGRPDAVWELAAPTAADAGLPRSDWGRFKKVAGVLVGQIPIDRRTSLYALCGDWLALACWLVVLFAAAWPFLRGKRRPWAV